MAERKVQSKHMPADFDPRVLQALNKKDRQKQKRAGGKNAEAAKKETVRVMLPFNICCSSCNSYMYRGRKFNAKKEEGADPSYLNTKVLRFHIKCETCSAPIVFRTDPKSGGFVVVSGARENKTTAGGFNPLADVVEKDEVPTEGLDAIAALEARAMETKKEQQVIQELEEELQRSKSRTEAIQKAAQFVGNTTASSSSVPARALSAEDEEEVARFREKKRALEFQGSELGNLTSPSLNLLGSSSDGGLFIRPKKKQAKVVTSLVPYGDDDSEDDA